MPGKAPTTFYRVVSVTPLGRPAMALEGARVPPVGHVTTYSPTVSDYALACRLRVALARAEPFATHVVEPFTVDPGVAVLVDNDAARRMEGRRRS